MRAPIATLIRQARELSEDRSICTAVTLQRRLRVTAKMAAYLEAEVRGR
jgi:hypothetical protein